MAFLLHLFFYPLPHNGNNPPLNDANKATSLVEKARKSTPAIVVLIVDKDILEPVNFFPINGDWSVLEREMLEKE